MDAAATMVLEPTMDHDRHSTGSMDSWVEQTPTTRGSTLKQFFQNAPFGKMFFVSVSLAHLILYLEHGAWVLTLDAVFAALCLVILGLCLNRMYAIRAVAAERHLGALTTIRRRRMQERERRSFERAAELVGGIVRRALSVGVPPQDVFRALTAEMASWDQAGLLREEDGDGLLQLGRRSGVGEEEGGRRSDTGMPRALMPPPPPPPEDAPSSVAVATYTFDGLWRPAPPMGSVPSLGREEGSSTSSTGDAGRPATSPASPVDEVEAGPDQPRSSSAPPRTARRGAQHLSSENSPASVTREENRALSAAAVEDAAHIFEDDTLTQEFTPLLAGFGVDSHFMEVNAWSHGTGLIFIINPLSLKNFLN